MTDKPITPARWTDQERDRLLILLADLDSVELKMSVPDADRGDARPGSLTADLMQVYFFDSPDLDLAGVIARARPTRAAVLALLEGGPDLMLAMIAV